MGQTGFTGSIRFRLTVFSLVFFIVTGVIVVFVFTTLANRELNAALGRELEAVVKTGVLMIDGDTHASLTRPEDENSPAYRQIRAVLKDIQRVSGAKFVYTMVRKGDDVIFIVDAADGDDQSHLGDIYSPGVLEGMAPAFAGKPSHDEEIVVDEWGAFKSGYAPIWDSKGRVVAILGVDMPADQIARMKNDMLIKTVIPIMGLFAVLAAVSLWVLRQTLKPIVGITEIVNKISTLGGNINFRLEVKRNDEIGMLADAVNRMLDEMGRLVWDVNRKAEELVATSLKIVPLVNDAIAVNYQLTDTFNSIAAGADRQKETMDSANASYSKIISQGADIKDKAGLSMASSVRMTETARENKDAVDNVGRIITSFTGTLREVVRVVKELHENSRSVQETANLINSISKRTNLLALNAGIEAAQSGSTGFSVVAAEVRNLSAQVGEAAQKIGRLLKGVSDKVQETSALTETSWREISALNESLSTTTAAYEGIVRHIQTVDGEIRDVVSSIDMQTGQIEFTERSIQEIRQIAETIATDLVRSSGVVEEEIATIRELESTAFHIQDIAAQLRDAVHKFET